MITSFGIVSLIVFFLCVAGLVLHYSVMKHRTRLDLALEALEILAEEDETTDEKYTAAQEEYDNALTAYKACISRFPGNVVAKVLGLPS